MFKKYAGLPAEVYILFLAAGINAMGTFVRPLTTLFLTDKLMYSESYTGMIIMIITALYVPGTLLGGALSDYLGRKKIYLFFGFLSAAASVMCGLYFETGIFIPMILISSFTDAIVQPAIAAMMMDLTNRENRQAAFSLQYLGVNLGFSIGPMIAGFLYQNYARIIFFGDAATTIIALAMAAILIPETLPDKDQQSNLPKLEHFEQGSTVQVLFRRPVLLAFAAVSMLYSLVYSQHGFTLPLLLEKLFPLQGAKFFGFLMTTNSLTVVFLTTPIAAFSSRWKSIYNISLAGIFFAVGFGMIFFARSLALFIATTLIWTIGEIVNVIHANVLIANNTPASHRGRLKSVVDILSVSAHALGPWLAGWFLMGYPMKWIWIISFAVALTGAIFMYVLYALEKKGRFTQIG